MPILGKADMKIQNLPILDAAVLEKLNDPIVSIPKLADQGYATIFLKDKAIVIKENDLKINADIVAQANRDNGKNGLYRFTNAFLPPIYNHYTMYKYFTNKCNKYKF